MSSRNLTKYQTKNPLKKIFLKRFIKKIQKKINKIENINSILDAGCGEGFIMKEINLTNKKADGLDISSESLNLAKKFLPNSNFFQGSIEKMPFKDESYDLVMATEVLEHLKNPEEALKEIIRVSKKYFLISVPWEPFFSLGNILSGKNLKRLGQDPEHLQFWSKKKINQLVKRQSKNISSEISFPWTILIGQK